MNGMCLLSENLGERAVVFLEERCKNRRCLFHVTNSGVGAWIIGFCVTSLWYQNINNNNEVLGVMFQMTAAVLYWHF